MLEDHPFAVCLTHDVDRPYKRLHHALYYAVRDRSLDHLRSIRGDDNPYWRFQEIVAMERELGVRSAFYFLYEPSLPADRPPREWLSAENWVQHLGRYDPADPDVAAVVRRLDAEGWEVGLHGSYHAATDPERLAAEKAHLESVLGHPVAGVRQHYLRLSVPETWRAQADLGFRYDASLGASETAGFEHGTAPLRPLDRPFVVFPLTLMEETLPDPAARPDEAWAVCEGLLAEAASAGAVMTVLWHPRYFSEPDFPGYAPLYRRLVEAALDAGAWVGPPGELLASVPELPGPDGVSARD